MSSKNPNVVDDAPNRVGPQVDKSGLTFAERDSPRGAFEDFGVVCRQARRALLCKSF
jgi:hypothetical protein